MKAHEIIQVCLDAQSFVLETVKCGGSKEQIAEARDLMLRLGRAGRAIAEARVQTNTVCLDL